MTPGQRLTAIFALLIPIIGGGTIFFHLVEGWSLLDSYFFSVVTLSTVGYGELVPVTPLGKIGTTVFIFTGLGIFAIAISQFGEFARDQQKKRRQRRASRHHGHHKSGKPETQDAKAVKNDE